MSRSPRIEGENLVYYISTEGKNRENIFKDDFDKEFLISLWKKHKLKCGLRYYAYVILPNKYALIMETSKSNLKSVMHNINSAYANYFKRQHNRKNKVFKDRYSCFLFERNNYLIDISLYIHLLPLEGRTTKSIYNYKWSSLPGYLNKKRRKNWIDYDIILQMIDRNPQTESSRYSQSIKQRLKKPIVSPFKKLRGETILGNEAFKKTIRKKQNIIANTKPEMLLAKKIIELTKQSFLNYPQKLKRIETKTLSRNASIYFLKKYTDLNNQQICCHFNSLNKSSIGQMNRRFKMTKINFTSVSSISKKIEREIKTYI